MGYTIDKFPVKSTRSAIVPCLIFNLSNGAIDRNVWDHFGAIPVPGGVANIHKNLQSFRGNILRIPLKLG
ncbi:MAG: hypothetical protein NT070_16075 [Cyanobacteria bacterium]|nr:hypothetical protein [Cyanobacteriota bacterium]